MTTDMGEVREFLAAPGDGVHIVFSTYQSAHVVGEASRGWMLSISPSSTKPTRQLDAKAQTSASLWRIVISKLRSGFFSPLRLATTTCGRRDKEGDKALVYSMDQPATYGPVVHTLSFAKAAERGIICNYKIIISIVTSEMINADLLSRGEVIVEGDVIRARTVANQIAIQKACEEHDLKKIFSFHRSVASAKDFTGDTASSIRTHLPDYETYHVNGEMRTSDREMYMKAFGEADRAIMSNARCLTEGVDVPAVDVVAFLSPRKSKVDIIQAAGRAMRKPEGKEMGYVLLPLFLETQENETLEEAVKRTDFEEAWDVLQAMQEQDAVLADIIREMREERGRKGGFDDSRLRERVEVLGPEVSLDVLRDAVSTAIVDRLGVTWDERYGELKRYKDRFGDCNVPRGWPESPRLTKWVQHSDLLHAKSALGPSVYGDSVTLALTSSLMSSGWLDKFDELQAFFSSEGHSNVPSRHPNRELARWVVKQRVAHREHRYVEKHGVGQIKRKDAGPKLSRWVTTQRQFQRRGRLDPERKRRSSD